MSPRHPGGCLALAIGAAVFAAAVAAPAAAEIYRCAGPGGRIVYTDNEAGCPGAEKHETSGRVQTLGPDPETEAPPGEPSEPDAQAPPEDAFLRTTEEQRDSKAHWQQLKRTKQAELRALEARHEELGRFVAACNRGQRIISRDATGIKQTVSCDRIREELARTRAAQEPVREYLETGLARDCRRAGCLPGWLR